MSTESFEFPLQKVLEWREALERERAVSLARARSDEAGARTALDGLRALTRERSRKVAQLRTAGAASVGHLQNLHLLVTQLEAQVAEASSRHAEARQELEASLEEFKGAHRDRKTLDNLRERKEEEWQVERVRSEQKQVEEVARRPRGLDEVVDGESTT